jgi:cell division initiation protein
MSTTSPPHVWRPDEVRRKQFTVRFRGLDPNEVRGFLNALADDVTRLHQQIATMKRDHTRQRDELEQAQDELAQSRAELQQVKGELQRAQLDPQDHVTDQAVLLLNQAQQLADALIDEGMQSARDLMVAARTHQREIVSPATEADHGPALPAGAAEHAGHGGPARSAEIEDIRTFARVAQVQFRAVLDALNEQVERLGSVSDTDEHISPANHPVPARTVANGRRG